MPLFLYARKNGNQLVVTTENVQKLTNPGLTSDLDSKSNVQYFLQETELIIRTHSRVLHLNIINKITLDWKD